MIGKQKQREREREREREPSGETTIRVYTARADHKTSRKAWKKELYSRDQVIKWRAGFRFVAAFICMKIKKGGDDSRAGPPRSRQPFTRVFMSFSNSQPLFSILFPLPPSTPPPFPVPPHPHPPAPLPPRLPIFCFLIYRFFPFGCGVFFLPLRSAFDLEAFGVFM